MRRNYFISALSIAMLVMVVIGCKKTGENITVPPEQAHFGYQNSGTYVISTPTTTYSIPVGITTVSNVDRTINVSVTSPTGAVEGTHYTLNKKTIVIPAGNALDSIVVQADQSLYMTGRRDSLIFTIQEGGVKASDVNKTFTLLVRTCREDDVNLSDLLGAYANTHESGFGAYGPYTTEITAVNQTSATTGTITVSNIWDGGWTPLEFNLDWTDPTNRVVTVVTNTNIGGNAGDLNSAYAGVPFWVRPHSNGQVGTFSYCNETFRLVMQIGPTGVGYFGNVYVVNMAR